jgi:hypothetical protein
MQPIFVARLKDSEYFANGKIKREKILAAMMSCEDDS